MDYECSEWRRLYKTNADRQSVKAVLSDNKILISISFAALIQTIKNDPQMTNLIHKIATTNDGQQHKDDNNNNAIKYLEVNKNSLSDLAEKHYENLVEALTNNAVANTSPNPTLSSSSSAFPSSFDQSDIYRREEPETYHNDNNDNKWDIAD